MPVNVGAVTRRVKWNESRRLESVRRPFLKRELKMKAIILALGLGMTLSTAMGKAPAPRPTTDKLLVSLMASPELTKFISAGPQSLKDGEFTGVTVQVDASDPKNIDYQFFFEYTKVGERDVSCNFTTTILFDSCSGNVGKLSAPIFTDLSCDE